MPYRIKGNNEVKYLYIELLKSSKNAHFIDRRKVF